MKYIDFIGQTIIIIAVIILALVQESFAIPTGAFVLGFWQMVSSVLSCLAGTAFNKLKVIHLVVATLYLGFTPVLLSQSGNAIWLFTVILPVALAVYYFILTICWAFTNGKRSKFLPHISF